MALLLSLLPCLSRAQVIFQIERISYLSGEVAIEFTDSRLNSEPTTGFALDFSEIIAAPTLWTYTSGATFSSLGGDRRLFTVPAPTRSGFYRVGLDSDADGLSDALEVDVLGSNPNRADSDEDGFSDRIEVSQETGLTDPDSRPLRGAQPGVQFAAANSRITEGAGLILIPIVVDSVYSGLVYYSLSLTGSATPESDFSAPQDGVISVNGTTASIPVTILDDLEVEDMEIIVLQLQDDAAGTYHTDAFDTHGILLIDNDANYSGLLQSGAGETSFRLCLLRFENEVSARLIPSPKSTASHLGGQLIPQPNPGQAGWPLTNVVLTATDFGAQSVPLPAGKSRLLGQTAMERTLIFSSVKPPPNVTNEFFLLKTNELFGRVLIGGDYTEILAPDRPAGVSLQFTNHGIFSLAREAPVLAPTQP